MKINLNTICNKLLPDSVCNKMFVEKTAKKILPKKRPEGNMEKGCIEIDDSVTDEQLKSLKNTD